LNHLKQQQQQQQQQQQHGFTLIELVVVIVILGVLAAIAAPRFIDLSSDANVAVLKSMGGGIKSAGQLVHGKATIQGLNRAAVGNVDLDGDGIGDIATRYGYPNASRTNGISIAMGDTFETEWLWSTTASPLKFHLTMASLSWTSGAYVNQVPIEATNCYLIYEGAVNAETLPNIEYVTSGC
jgi:MSHA pilin protein MshA